MNHLLAQLADELLVQDITKPSAVLGSLSDDELQFFDDVLERKRQTNPSESARTLGVIRERIQSGGWTRINRMSQRRCLPEAEGRPPGNVFSDSSRSAISSAFMRIQFGRGRLLKPSI